MPALRATCEQRVQPFTLPAAFTLVVAAELINASESAADAAPLVDGVETDCTDAPEGAGEGVGGVQRAAQRWLREGLDTGRRPDSETYR